MISIPEFTGKLRAAVAANRGYLEARPQSGYYVRPRALTSAPEPRMLTVQVWDRSNVQPVEKAIRSAGLGLNPITDGTTLRIPLPELNEQRRAVLVQMREAKVAAPPDEVWSLIADVTQMGSWSPETESCEWLGGATGPAAGGASAATTAGVPPPSSCKACST